MAKVNQMRALSNRDLLILQRRFVEKKQLRPIAEELGLSQEAVSTSIPKTLRRLRLLTPEFLIPCPECSHDLRFIGDGLGEWTGYTFRWHCSHCPASGVANLK